MEKIFITGASGLLGSYLIRDLLKQPSVQLVCIYRKQKSNLLTEEELSSISWVQGDILDVDCLMEAMQGCKKVYHCAGLVSFNPSKANELMKINVEGTANVVNTAIECGVEKFIHVSSVAAIGRKRNNQTVHESLTWDEASNPSVYGKSKYLGEMEVWRGIGEGLNAVIVNPVIILGKGDWNDGSCATFKNAYNEFPWYTEGISGFVDAADVSKAMIGLMESEISGERYIVSAENLSYRSFFEMMADGFLKKRPHIKVSPLLAAIVWRLVKVKSMITGEEPLLTKETAETAQQKVYFDHSKLVSALPGFRFTPVAQTIQEACSYYLRLTVNG
ncbi:MAG: NAD-dependent epimerase/dehydratase family protein [Bacteroidetes bacterium]|nr:NAD-dependent epimerase/dehydratase family protein [Bacteroidota bacterium]